MTDPTVLAAAAVTVIVALTTGIVTVVNAIAAARDRRSSRQERAALAETATSTERKADTIIEKAVEIHTQTNGSLSKVQAQLEIANEKILGLNHQIRGLETLIATLTAAARARRRSTDPHD